MKIQSVSDIITNSSSEVFMIIDGKSMTKMNNVINHLLRAFGINKDVNEVLKIKKKCSFYADENIKTLITTGYICENPSYCWTGEIDNLWKQIEGYPVCSSEKEITDDIYESAADVYYDLMQDEFFDYECGPIFNDIQIVAKSPEYNKIASAINDLIHAMDYREFSC